ncbi:MAG: hypothetical protein Kow0069_13110 [Promethearchaeota archaeon]
MALDDLPLFVPASFSFASDWFHHHAGSTYEESLMRDPVARNAQSAREGRFVRRRYPELFRPASFDASAGAEGGTGAGEGGSGELADGDDARPGSASLGMGVVTLPTAFGARVRFQAHMDPQVLPVVPEGSDPASVLRVPDMEEGLRWVFEEIDALVDAGYEKGRIAMPNLQGPLNVATVLVGDRRMLSLVARRKKADVVDRVLDVTTEAFVDATKALRRALGRSTRGPFTVAGCTHYYLSPRSWTRFVLPRVRRMVEELGGPARLHHCGEANEQKVETYAQFPWASVELGFGSALRRARELFVSPRYGPLNLSCRVSPYRLLNQPAAQVRRDVEWILSEVRGGPANVSVVGVPLGTPDGNLRAMRAAVDAYNERKAAELELEL